MIKNLPSRRNCFFIWWTSHIYFKMLNVRHWIWRAFSLVFVFKILFHDKLNPLQSNIGCALGNAPTLTEVFTALFVRFDRDGRNYRAIESNAGLGGQTVWPDVKRPNSRIFGLRLRFIPKKFFRDFKIPYT